MFHPFVKHIFPHPPRFQTSLPGCSRTNTAEECSVCFWFKLLSCIHLEPPSSSVLQIRRAYHNLVAAIQYQLVWHTCWYWVVVSGTNPSNYNCHSNVLGHLIACARIALGECNFRIFWTKLVLFTYSIENLIDTNIVKNMWYSFSLWSYSALPNFVCSC